MKRETNGSISKFLQLRSIRIFDLVCTTRRLSLQKDNERKNITECDMHIQILRGGEKFCRFYVEQVTLTRQSFDSGWLIFNLTHFRSSDAGAQCPKRVVR